MSPLEKNIRYFLKKPDKTRKTYSLVKYILHTRTQKEYLKLNDSEIQLLSQVNELFKSKSIRSHEAEARLNKFIKEQALKQSKLKDTVTESIISDYNSRIYKKFWTEKYEDRELVDSSSARYDFKRALKELSSTAVDADVKTIKSSLKHLKPTKLKRVYARLNELRSFLGIKEKLSTNKSEVTSISYITLPELHKILKSIEDSEIKAAIATLFGTGVRLGELLALKESDLIGDYLNITKQIKPSKDITLPKRGKTGKIVIIKDLKKYALEFLAIKEKELLRYKIQSEVVNVSNKVLKRHIHVHDLRHSHAIYLLSKGASLTLISLQLRNRIEVCQKYYSGFAHTDDTLNLLNKIASE